MAALLKPNFYFSPVVKPRRRAIFLDKPDAWMPRALVFRPSRIGRAGAARMWVFNVAVIAPMLAGFAAPGFQSAKWGSSPQEVQRAMKVVFPTGDPHQAEPPDGHTYANAKYASGAMTFSAMYRFTSAHLDRVQLTLLGGGDCSALRETLIGKYGKPIEITTTVPNRLAWRDIAAGNRIELKIYADSYCPLEYAPLKTSAAAGL